MDSELERKVNELWEKEKIRELTYRYGQTIERRDEEAMSRLYTEDGTVDFSETGLGVHRGRANIKDFYATTWTQRVKAFFTNHLIEIIDDRHARGVCCYENRAVRNGESVMGAGRLHDEYEKVEGQWKFRSRRLELFYSVPVQKGWIGVGKMK